MSFESNSREEVLHGWDLRYLMDPKQFVVSLTKHFRLGIEYGYVIV